MKKLIFLIALFGLLVTGVQAQQTNDKVSIKQIDINGTGSTDGTISEEDLMSHYSKITGFDYWQQLSSDASKVASIQVNGNYNEANIIQNGSSNTGAINIAGNQNKTTLDQSGSNLLSLIYLDGNQNNIDVTQRDNNLGNLIQVEGSGLNIGLKQDQTGFRYIQGGAGGNPIMITSSNNYVPIIIKNH